MKWLLLALALALVVAAQPTTCQIHIAELTTMALLDKAKFAEAVHGYVLYSGKMNDDLGMPDSCNKYDSYSYFTGAAKAINESVLYRAYLGICFSSKCTPQDLNDNTGFIVNRVLNITNITDLTMTFTQPALQVEATPGFVVCLLLFLVLVAISVKDVIGSFFRNCKKEAYKEDEQLYGKYAIQFGEDYDPTLLIIHENEGFFKRMCLASKLHEYFVKEESSKIVSFSALRVLAVPLALYGYLFYLANLGSYNYSAINDEIYNKTYAKLALAAYYIPDTLFFISGFLMAKKASALLEVETRANSALTRLVISKLSYLVPLYWAFVVIYWQISPSLHAGPVWSEYQDEAAVCDTAWWRVLLFIDNWFEHGCYDFGWYLPAEIQMVVVGCGVLWVYSKNKQVGMAVLVLLMVGSWVLTLVLSAPFPSSIETTLSSFSASYFKSTYSHLPYYLLGVLNGHLAYQEQSKATLQNLTKNTWFRVTGLLLGFTLIILIIFRPSLWEGELGFELGLAKTGMFLGMYLLMFWTMFGGQMRTTLLHRMAILSKGVLLMGGIVVGSYFWTGYTFPYLDCSYLVNVTVANLLIAIPAGTFVLALLWPKPRKVEQIIL